MVISTVSKAFRKVFGTRNDRLVKAYQRRVDQINLLEPQISVLADAQLRTRTQELRYRLANGERMSELTPEALAVAREAMDRSVGIRNIFDPDKKFDPQTMPQEVRPLYDQVCRQIQTLEPAEEPGCSELIPGWQQVDIPVEIYQAVRSLYPQSRPPFRARPFDVQLIGGMVLSEGRIAEMKTGEGKTIVAPLACYLACLERLYCYVVTVNDFLVQRDRDWVFPFYYHLGLTVGAIHPMHMQQPQEKTQAYQCDVVYGTNSEFGFDYLRDNMCLGIADQVQTHMDFCVIDEVDSILIDEARTPLIISGPAHDDAPRYGLADGIARHLMHQQCQWDAANAKVTQCQVHVKGLEGNIRNSRDKAAVPAMRHRLKEYEEQLPTLEEARDRHIQYYEVEMEKKSAHLSHEGVAEAQKQANIGSFYVGNNMDFPHLLENALRAHAVYQRDKDYVVQEGEVVIVDEFTGRLMIGRQWSDGLHQAVEAKEKVKIKQETQTLATVTIQNYFKLYERLAGMTGTAITEATEFNDIYKLDVVCIPTNAQVVRVDRDDLIFLTQKDKWDAILEEIARHHDLGRPVLVGTTSVEKSETLSQMLTKKHGIKHEVLNAKQHEREAHIVEHAGELGAVMIATNMAGRGTDIRLAKIDRNDLVRHWQQRDLLPKQARAELPDAPLISMAYKHMAVKLLDTTSKQLDTLSDDQVQLRLARHWVETQTWTDPKKVSQFTLEQCQTALDKVPGFIMHRLFIPEYIETIGGLHIVGTERHEARRIDNQLRGRSGRQGDNGYSRFFISIEDDLMQLFAKGWLMKALPKLGMKEGDALEHRWVTKAVERAQRKVEERNFEIRKNLLEYDEVMEFQRNAFYTIRQTVLEGRGINDIVFNYIDDAVMDACDQYLDGDYVHTQVGEWCRGALDVSVEASKLHMDSFEHIQQQVRSEARADMRQTLEVTLGEYMSDDITLEQWDLRGLSSWAMSRFSVDLKQNQLRKMSVDQIRERLTQAADEQIEKKNLSGLAKFMDERYAQNDLAEWAQQKFGLKLDIEKLAPLPSEKPDMTKRRVAQYVLEQANNAYDRRELTYPIEFILDMYVSTSQQDPQWAADQIAQWVNQRYDAGWGGQDILEIEPAKLYDRLMTAARPWYEDGRLEALVDKTINEHNDDPQALVKWSQQRFGQEVDSDELGRMDRKGRADLLVKKGRAMLRSELTVLERFVLLQILDAAWKDHLYAMDQLRDAVSARSITDRERDPRVVYKREGSLAFEQMQKVVRDRVTGLIFRARLTANVQARSVYGRQQAEHAESQSAMAGTAQQREDLEAAQHAGQDEPRPMSRKSRRAAAAGKNRQEPVAVAAKQAQFKRRKKRSR